MWSRVDLTMRKAPPLKLASSEGSFASRAADQMGRKLTGTAGERRDGSGVRPERGLRPGPIRRGVPAVRAGPDNCGLAYLVATDPELRDMLAQLRKPRNQDTQLGCGDPGPYARHRALRVDAGLPAAEHLDAPRRYRRDGNLGAA
jgi:hypothetical protein